MKRNPILPVLSLIGASILFGLSYYEVKPVSDQILHGTLFATVAICFSYWVNPCKSESQPNGFQDSLASQVVPTKPIHSMLNESTSDPKSVEAVIVYRKSPSLQLLHLRPTQWISNSPHGETTVENAIKDVAQVTGIDPESFKTRPKLLEGLKIEFPKTTIKFHPVEVSAWTQPKLEPNQFKWLSIEDSLKKTCHDCEGIRDVLKKLGEEWNLVKPLRLEVENENHMEEIEDGSSFNDSVRTGHTKDPLTVEPNDVQDDLVNSSLVKKSELLWRIVEKKSHHLTIKKTYKDESSQDEEQNGGFMAKLFGFFKINKITLPAIYESNKSKAIIIGSTTAVILVLVTAAILGTYFLRPELFKA